MALDATSGGAAANSYVTEAEADAYFATGLFAATWAALATSAAKEALLIEAARALEAAYAFNGARDSATQALAFPRSHGAPDILEEDGIPVRVKQAQMEMVAYRSTNVASAGATSRVIDKVRVEGVVSLEYSQTTASQEAGASAGGTLDRVEALLAPFVLYSGGGAGNFAWNKF